MAIATEQILVEVITDTSTLDAAIDQLVKLGAIDQQIAGGFKTTTAEINRQGTALKGVGSAAAANSKSLDAVANSAKNASSSFASAFKSGVISSLMEAGVTLEDFEQQLGELGDGNIALARLGKSLLEIIDRVKQTGAELEALEASGQQGTESFAKLEQQLNEDVLSLQKMTREITVLKKATNVTPATASINQLTKSLKEATTKVSETTAALDKLKKEGSEGTETFAKMQAQLKADEEELVKINAALSVLSDQEGATIPPIVPEGTKEKVQSIKSELKNLRAEIAQAIATNQNFGESFEALVARAGELDDAISDAGAAIKRTGSDTSTFDGLIAGAQGVAAGFSVAQGAAALFGDESEATQKVLLKVNAAMAVLQGLQQIAALREKESAISLLLSNAQRKINNAQIAISSALESKNIIVRGAATVAQRLLNAAMAANPIGIVVVALAGLIALLATYGRSAAQAARETSNLNVALGAGQDAAQRRAEAAQAAGESIVQNLQTEGALQSRITAKEIENDKQQAAIEKENLESLRKDKEENTKADLEQRQALDAKISELEDSQSNRGNAIRNKEAALKKSLSKEALQDRVSNVEAELALAKEGSRRQLELQKQLIAARAEQDAAGEGLVEGQRKAIEAKAQQETLEAQKSFNRAQIEQQIKLTETRIDIAQKGSDEELQLQKRLLASKASLDTIDAKSAEEKILIAEKLNADLLKLDQQFENTRTKAQVDALNARLENVRAGSQEELRLKQEILAKEAAIELNNAELTADQRRAITEKLFQDQLKLSKEDIANRTQEEIQARIAANDIILQTRKGTEEELRRVQIDNINANAQLEIFAAEGNATKIIAIKEKQAADILQIQREAAVAAAQLQFDNKVQDDAPERRRLQSVLELNRSTFAAKKDAVRQINELDQEENNNAMHLLRVKLANNQISEGEYNLEYKKLLDKRKELDENNAKDTLAIDAEKNKARVQMALEALQGLSNVFSTIADIQAEKDSDRIEGMKKVLQDEIDSGSITEKQAKARASRIEIEEKKARQKQAERNKSLAVFNALIATAQAVAQALPNIPLSIIVGAIGLAQAALIASRPIPKFRSGKKHLYEGLGEVGESGTEIVERNGTMYVVDKPTITWLGSKDKVYTPFETQQILKNKPEYKVNKTAMAPTNGVDSLMDLTKELQALHKTMKNKNGVTVNIDKEGITEFFEKTMSEIHYMNNRYRFKR